MTFIAFPVQFSLEFKSFSAEMNKNHLKFATQLNK